MSADTPIIEPVARTPLQRCIALREAPDERARARIIAEAVADREARLARSAGHAATTPPPGQDPHAPPGDRVQGSLEQHEQQPEAPDRPSAARRTP
jgi:hypothetical protein